MVVKGLGAGLCLVVGALAYMLCDYVALQSLEEEYHQALEREKHMQSEAQHVSAVLEATKERLKKVDDYMQNLSEMVSLKVGHISQKTGIGPLSEEEELLRQKNASLFSAISYPGKGHTETPSSLLGISYDDFVFRPLVQNIHNVDALARVHSHSLKNLLITFQQKRHLFSSIPLGKPVTGWVTSHFGMRTSPFTGKRAMHYGIDIAARVGSPIHAPADGVIIFSGKKSGFGNFLMMAHDHGIVTKYGHNAELFVKTGEKVNRGDPIASVGNSGRSTGPHLHYEIWVNGKPKNPKKFFLHSDLAWSYDKEL